MTDHTRTEPVRLHVEMPTSRDCWTALGRPLLVLPHALLVGGPFVGFGIGAYRFGALGLAACTIAAFDWFAILFTGHPIAGLQELKRFYLRWRARALAYACFLRDEFPPFGEGDYPVSLELPAAPATRNLPSVVLRPLLVLPHLLLLLVLLLAATVVWLVSWFTLVFTRRMSAPRSGASAATSSPTRCGSRPTRCWSTTRSRRSRWPPQPSPSA